MSFAYLATPYSEYDDGHEAAFKEAARVSAWLTSKGVAVFSPIVHGHPMSDTGILPYLGFDLWMGIDAPFMQAADRLIVVRMRGWDNSSGVAREIAEFKKAGKPIFYLDPP